MFLFRESIAKVKPTAAIIQRAWFSSSFCSSTTRPTTNQKKIPFYGLPASKSSSTISDKIQRLIQQSYIAIQDPTRADAVAAVSELTGSVTLSRILQNMQTHPVGREILKDQPWVQQSELPPSILQIMKEGLIPETATSSSCINNNTEHPLTFGQAYGLFLHKHGFDPDHRDPVRDPDLSQNPSLAYVMTRYRQSHDYWHTLTGLPPTVLGELALKGWEFVHLGMPVALLSVMTSTQLLNKEERDFLWTHYLPWALRSAHRPSNEQHHLMCVYYEREFDTPLEELRKRMGIEVAPVFVQK